MSSREGRCSLFSEVVAGRMVFSSLKLSFSFLYTQSLFASSQSATSTSARYLIISKEETDSIMQSAADCADGECSVDDVSELVAELQEQKKVLQTRLDKITKMMSDLEHVNQKDARKPDEVRGLVQDMLRVFSRDPPKFRATGYPGEVGKGTTDAYDALPPKKWKAAEKK
jgi:hypothetical protein